MNRSTVNAHTDVALRVVAFYFPWELILLQSLIVTMWKAVCIRIPEYLFCQAQDNY